MANFWQARPPQWRLHQRRAAAAPTAALLSILQNLGKAVGALDLASHGGPASEKSQPTSQKRFRQENKNSIFPT